MTSADSDLKLARLTEAILVHQGLVRWQISRLVRDPNLVDDLAQEVFFAWLEANQARPAVLETESVQSVKSWLVAVARNKAVDWLRKNARQAVLPSRKLDLIDPGQMEHVASAGDSEEQTQAATLRLESLNHCLKLLKPEHRDMVHEFYSLGKSSELIGVQIGKGSNSVRMMLTRIRRALGKCIENQLARLR